MESKGASTENLYLLIEILLLNALCTRVSDYNIKILTAVHQKRLNCYVVISRDTAVKIFLSHKESACQVSH